MDGFSRHIDLEMMERESRRLLGAGFAFAVAFHILVAVLFALTHPEAVRRIVREAERHIVTDLIPVPPRPKNPYDTWTGPELYRRPDGRMFSPVIPNHPGAMTFKALPKYGDGAFRFRGEDYGVDTDALIRAIVASGRLNPKRPVNEPEPYRPERIRDPYIPRRTDEGMKNRISMRDEMLTVENLKTGKYKGLVVIDLANERALKGYLFLPAAVRGDSMRPPSSTRRAVTGLATALGTHTGIIVTPEKQIELSSPDIFAYPLLVITADAAFDTTPVETNNLGKYLRSGGFVFMETCGASGDDGPSPSAASFRKLVKGALGPSGELRPVPGDHFLYHSRFDFDDGPPRTRRDDTETPGGQPPGILEGAWIGERLAVVYSEKQYAESWGNPKGSDTYRRMGVNIVAFALTQPGGIAVRLVDDSGR